MNAFLSKLAMVGVVAGGFFVTGDLSRLIERGRKITERSTVPLPATSPAAEPPASATFAASPPPAVAAAQPAPRMPAIPEPAAAPPVDRPADEPTRIPMPRLTLESVDLAALQPGQRVLLLCGRHVVALDVIDGPAGEVLEHAHAIHADRTVSIASTATARRLAAIGTSAGPARLPSNPDGWISRGHGRIIRGQSLHMIPSGIPSGGAASATETIGPIEAIGLE